MWVDEIASHLGVSLGRRKDGSAIWRESVGFECPGKRGCHGCHRSGVEDAEKWEIQMGRNFPFKSFRVSGEIKFTSDPPSPISHLNLSGVPKKSSLLVIRRLGR